MKLRTVMADDEELARRVLCEYLNPEQDIEIVAECANGFEAVKAVNELGRIWFFSTCRCPLDGFEVIDSSTATPPWFS